MHASASIPVRMDTVYQDRSRVFHRCPNAVRTRPPRACFARSLQRCVPRGTPVDGRSVPVHFLPHFNTVAMMLA